MNPKLNLKKLQPHPLGALFPTMGDEEYTSLKKGMKINGFDPAHPIIILDDMILEGNHRYTAAKDTKTEPVFKDFDELRFEGSPIDYVIQENLSRRNLNPSQLGQVGADLVEQMVEAEKAAKAAGAANSQTGEKVAAAAKKVGVSKRQVAAARALKKKDPKAAADVKAGKKRQHAAGKDVEAKQSAEEAKTKEFADATGRIDKLCGAGFSLIAAKVLNSKDILKLSGLDAAEIKRIKPFLEDGWKLKDAIGYKSVELSERHRIEELKNRAIASGTGKHMLVLNGWIYTAERKAE